MLLVVQADDLVLLLIGWEVMGLCSYLLVGHDSQRLAARRAAVKAFLVTRVGDVGFVLGIIVLISATKTSSIIDPAAARRPGWGVAGWVWPVAVAPADGRRRSASRRSSRCTPGCPTRWRARRRSRR